MGITNIILETLTNNVIFGIGEKEKLRKRAKKITKTPEIIKIPSEYLVGEKETR